MSNYLQELYNRVEQTSKTDKEFVGKLSHLSEGTQLNVLSGVQHFILSTCLCVLLQPKVRTFASPHTQRQQVVFVRFLEKED